MEVNTDKMTPVPVPYQELNVGEFYARFYQRQYNSTGVWYIYSTIAPNAVVNRFCVYRLYEVIFSDNRAVHRFYMDDL